MKRGEIWWHEPPDEKPRPVLILTRDEAIRGVADIVAMPATRTPHDWLTEVELGKDDGMPTESFLVAENTLSAEKVYLVERITTLGASKMTDVCQALNAVTGCLVP